MQYILKAKNVHSAVKKENQVDTLILTNKQTTLS